MITAKDILEVQPMTTAQAVPQSLIEQRHRLKDALRNFEKVEVVFVKKDGSHRTLIGTLYGGHIPKDKWPKAPEVTNPLSSTTLKKKSDEVQTIFDIEKQDWRSIRYDSVVSVRGFEPASSDNTYWLGDQNGST